VKRTSSDTSIREASESKPSQIKMTNEESILNLKPESTILFINESQLYKIPAVELILENGKKIKAILDTGSEINLLTEIVYLELKESGVEIPTLPVEKVVSNSIRKEK
jgi:hypothetical protein